MLPKTEKGPSSGNEFVLDSTGLEFHTFSHQTERKERVSCSMLKDHTLKSSTCRCLSTIAILTEH